MNFDFWKSKKFLAVIVILILVIGGFFYWHNSRPTPPEEWDTAKVSPRKDYVVRDTPEGKVVENEKVGLRFKVPEGWKIEEDPSYVSYISFYSPEAETAEGTYLAKKGCKITVSVKYIKTNLDIFEKKLKKEWPSSELNTYERIDINDKNALKHTFTDKENDYNGVGIHLPVRDRLYGIALDSSFQDKEKCEAEFNKFLETISIE